VWWPFPAHAAVARVKEVASVQGVRSNPLQGLGLVIGLDGTGDQTTQAPFTAQSLQAMLQQMGVTLPPGVSVQSKNIAAVMVTANLPAFAQPGQPLDVAVASIGNAKSLRGGTLLMAPLRGADGQVYAIAQGNLVVSGLTADGSDGSNITINVPSVGRIPNGATVERAVDNPFMAGDHLVLNLRAADFTTANRLAESINTTMGPGTARPIDATSVQVNAPRDAGQRVAYVSMLENLELEPDVGPARVVVNSRTGTVVIGLHVKILPVAVAHGSLTVTVTEDVQVSQPGEFATAGRTAVTPSSYVDVAEEPASMFLIKKGVTLNDIVMGVNRVGAAPSDLVAILEALKEAGALRAELIIL